MNFNYSCIINLNTGSIIRQNLIVICLPEGVYLADSVDYRFVKKSDTMPIEFILYQV